MVPNLVLGSAEVTLLEMTVGMDAIAVDCNAIEPRKIRTGPGRCLYPSKRLRRLARVAERLYSSKRLRWRDDDFKL